MTDIRKTGQAETMWAMSLQKPGGELSLAKLAVPLPGPEEIQIRVRACGVCRTDLHIVDQDLPAHKSPVIPGHEVVGEVTGLGPEVRGFSIGDRVGVPWLGSTCHHCPYCLDQRENLCDNPQFTGYDRDGGYAQYMVADARYCFAIPDKYDDLHAAPLLCAGLIGYRAYLMTGNVQSIGLYGFGAAAHILIQVAKHQGKRVLAFTRPDDMRSQDFARSLGADWAGDSMQEPPVQLDAAIIFAPVGDLVPAALRATRKGGVVVCAGIHMSNIPSFPYSLLWGERVLRSVANLTRADGEAFFSAIQEFDLHTSPTAFPMHEANRALSAVRNGSIDGAAVLVMKDGWFPHSAP